MPSNPFLDRRPYTFKIARRHPLLFEVTDELTPAGHLKLRVHGGAHLPIRAWYEQHHIYVVNGCGVRKYRLHPNARHQVELRHRLDEIERRLKP